VSDTVMVIGTTMAPATKLTGVTNPKYVFTEWNFFKGASESVDEYYSKGHVVGISLWASW